MNKKGFTLVELLATISILVLMSVIIGVNITSILRSTEDTQENFDKEQIEKAACVYVDSSLNENKCSAKSGSCSEITVNDLISGGLLDDSYSDLGSKTIKITWENNEKICSYE